MTLKQLITHIALGYNECDIKHKNHLSFWIPVHLVSCLFLGTPESHWRLPAAQWEGPGRWSSQRRWDPEPVRRQLWLWCGVARVASPESEAGTGSLAGGGAAGLWAACHPDTGDHEEAYWPRSRPGPPSIRRESHGSSSGAADCLGALGRQVEQSP